MEYQQDLDRVIAACKYEFPDSLEIIGITSWKELENRMREVRLKGDSSIFPYASASIESRRVMVENVYPLSLYALSGQIAFHREMRKRFLQKYNLDIFDLSGIVEYQLGGKVFRLAPPVIEESSVDGNKQLLVDGIHRFLVAKFTDQKSVRVISVSNVPAHLPLVPLPLCWDEVKIFDGVPPETEKRRFRFLGLNSFPDISNFSQVQITESTFRYFFYRDLSTLGSSGIRREQESK